jgi:hypothetical protein
VPIFEKNPRGARAKADAPAEETTRANSVSDHPKPMCKCEFNEKTGSKSQIVDLLFDGAEMLMCGA